MIQLVFATNNAHKLYEVQNLLPGNFKVISLAEIGCTDDIPETADTLEGNALLKARYIHQRYGCNCFADDTGLEIEVLNGRPGVYSARYAGEHCSFEDNMQKVLGEMQASENRNAAFRTVIALILNEKEYLFEGKVNGTICHEKHGNEGFGYDPVFRPTGYTKTFAEMPLAEKNKISHRARATQKLVEFLNSL